MDTFTWANHQDGASDDDLGRCVQTYKMPNAARPLLNGFAPEAFKKPFIIINKDLENRSLEELETTVYHELGHCLLRREHEDDQSGLMNGKGGAPKRFLVNTRYFYLKEFFNGGELTLPNTMYPRNPNSNSSEKCEYKLFYEYGYSAFGKKIKGRLYRNPRLDIFEYEI